MDKSDLIRKRENMQAQAVAARQDAALLEEKIRAAVSGKGANGRSH